MHPAFHNDLVHARQHDLMRSAAQQRLAAQVKAAHVQEARRARPAGTTAAPKRRVLRLVWRLLPA
jgi:hypothetical protein